VHQNESDHKDEKKKLLGAATHRSETARLRYKPAPGKQEKEVGEDAREEKKLGSQEARKKAGRQMLRSCRTGIQAVLCALHGAAAGELAD